MNIYLIDVNQNPLMPCHNGGFIRNILKQGKAKVVRNHPFTVQLLYEVRNKYKQEITLGIDAGYKYIGLSASTTQQEVVSAELEQDCGMVERNKERRMYRRQRRSRLRYRASRFSNRVVSKPEGWLAPSLQRKKETHLRFIEMLRSILPITHIRVEIGLFDPTLLKATMEGTTIQGIEYQQGESAGFDNMKSYIRYRDNYTCQNPNCACHKMKKEDREKLRLFVHHIGYWKHDRTNRPSNLITLCELSHTSANHQIGGLLYGWQPKVKPLKEVAFMNIVRKEIVEELKCLEDVEVHYIYGYTTNRTRSAWNIEKSHHDDAFCIAKNYSTKRCKTLYFKQKRRNNRSLELFYDAKYIDKRDSKKKSGKTLFNGRTTRNRNYVEENLHMYRGQKLSKGKRSIRKQHYMLQPHDIVKYQGKKHVIKGIHCKGTRAVLDNKQSVAIKKIQLYQYSGGYYLEKEVK